jgi:chemotaxis protein CheD
MIINVGMADLMVSETPDILQTTLGSCIGIAIYDRGNRIGGLAHIMLPVNNNGDPNKAKYADTAISELIRKLASKGVDKGSLLAKIAGGAKMFDTNKKINYFMEIGLRNEEAVREGLKREGIRLVSSDTGSNYGRNIQFEIATGRITVKSHGKEMVII